MAQYARPDSDVTKGNWDDPNGNNNDILYDDIDEETPSDSDYIESPDDPSSESCEVGLSDVTDPESSSGHTIRVRYQAPESGGGQPATIDFTIALMEGATERASWVEQPDPPTTWATASYTLTTGEADSIGNYANLRLRFTANKTGGARTTRIEVSWAEFEVPDAAGAIVKIMPSILGLSESDLRRGWMNRLSSEMVGLVDSLLAKPWLGGWAYRKKIPITGQSGAGTNYQVPLTVHSGAGSDSDGVVYLGGHCTNFPNDIRFTDDDATTLLDHWLETGSGTPRKFWIEVKDDLGSNQEFYIYYGKSGAPSDSDGDATFELFDDFPGTSLDTSKWNDNTDPDDDLAVNDGLTITLNDVGSSRSVACLDSKDAFSHPLALESKWRTDFNGPTGGSTTTAVRFCKALHETSNTYWSSDTYYFANMHLWYDNTPSDWLNILRTEAGQAGDYDHNLDDIDVRGSLLLKSGASKEYRNGTLELEDSHSTSLDNTAYFGLHYYINPSLAIGSQYIYVSFVAVRKYNDPEPSVGTAGSEEEGPAEALIKIMSAILGISEADLYRNRAIRMIAETVSLADSLLRRLWSVRPFAETVGLTDSILRKASVVRLITETVGIAESFVKATFTTIVKLMAETVAMADTIVRRMWSVRIKAETLGIVDSLLRRLWSIRQMAETISLQDAILRRMSSVRIKAETISIQDTALKVFAIVKQMEETLGLGDAMLKVAGMVRVASETVGIAENWVKFTVSTIVKVMLTETVGLAETTIKRLWATRLMAETVGLTEPALRRLRAVRLITATVALQEALVKRMWSIRQITETISISEVGVLRKRFVKIISETIGLVESFVKAVSLYLGIEEIELDSHITPSVDLDSAIAKTVEKDSQITKTWEAESYIQ